MCGSGEETVGFRHRLCIEGEAYGRSEGHVHVHQNPRNMFFDVCLNWKGLLVEANSCNYLRVAKLRPNAHHLCVAPSCKEPSVVKFPLHLYTSGRQNEEGSELETHCEQLSWSLEQLGIRA